MNIFRVIFISSIIILIAFSTYAQSNAKLYRYKTGSKFSYSYYLIVDSDTAYTYWMYTHHWIRYSSVDTLYKQGNIYKGRQSRFILENDKLYTFSKTDNRGRRIREAGRTATHKWNRMHYSVSQNPYGDKEKAEVLSRLYQRYAPLHDKQ